MTTKMARPEALIFDMDGTLFKSESIFVEAFHLAMNDLRKEGLYAGENPSEKVLLGSLGLLLDDIWNRVLPKSTKAARERLNDLVLDYQIENLKAGKGELYPRVRETLERLRNSGMQLFVASNGLELYVKKVAEHTDIAHLFTGLYSAGEYQTASKNDLVKLLLDTHRVSSAWMVGDRLSDVAAGKANGLTVIGCDYAGYGHDHELAEADAVITAFAQLPELIAAE
ncbi:MAG TPA: HAD hydrolase-like protein [Bacilli bacterium]